jgi:hypothetical protein
LFFMTNAQPVPESDPDTSDLDPVEQALSEAHALRRLAMLEQMAEIGMALMQGLQRRVERQLAAEEAGETTSGEALSANETAHDTALAFSRLTRAMRLTFALDARLREELRLREYGPPAGAAAPAANDDDDDGSEPDWTYHRDRPNQVALRRAMYRNAVNTVMTEAIETHTDDPAEIERLRGALYEHLFESEAYDDIKDWGLKQSLQCICVDLDLDPDIVSHWLPQSWASAMIFSKPIRPPGVPDRPHRPPYDTNYFGPGPQRRPPDG